jgi:general secretion pathway protein I
MRRTRNKRTAGFTLIEVLAAMLLIAIALPAIMRGISMAGSAATISRQRTEAAGLAEAQLNQMIADETWQSGVLAGDFATYPDYHWRAQLQSWPLDSTSAGIQQIDLQVYWNYHGREENVTVSTLTYQRTAQTTGG